MLGIAGSVTNSCDITHKLVSNQGSALFDGTNDFIDASSVASDISLTAGSISLWARITTTSGNESFFNVSDGTSGDNKLVLMYNTSSAVIQANYKAGGASQQAQYSISNSAIVSAGWFHIVMTYDTTANEVKLYYNGSLVNTRIIGVDAIDGSSVTFDRVILGKSANADNTYHQGYIDEYAYFTRVLTADEVSSIYAAKAKFNYAESLSLKGTANGLKQWLRFGDGRMNNQLDQTRAVDDRIILDMANVSLGSELIRDPFFEVNSVNTGQSEANLSATSLKFDHWIEQNSSGERTFTKITNGIRCTIVTSTDNTWHTRVYQTINPVLEIGSYYYFSATGLTSKDTNFRLAVQTTGSSDNQFLGEGANVSMTANVPKRNEGFFKCDNNTSQVIHVFPQYSSGCDGEFYEVSNLSLRQLSCVLRR